MRLLTRVILLVSLIVAVPLGTGADEVQKDNPPTKEELDLKKSIDQTSELWMK